MHLSKKGLHDYLIQTTALLIPRHFKDLNTEYSYKAFIPMGNTVDLSSDVEPDFEKPVLQFIVCGSPVIDTPTSPLHWRIYLHMGDHKSILVDMTIREPSEGRGKPDATGWLFISKKDYAYSNTSDMGFVIIPKKGRIVTVRNVLEMIRDLKRDKYRFDTDFGGCRYWCSIIIADLEKKGFIAPGYSVAFETFIEQKHSENPARYPLPTRQGTFTELPSE
ncbi:hypothetical protein SCHPADRAFT_939313 [Schizopora paradoxa]|uniref:DUF7770 domain-containing protein n=1 Tax=Schizopora paradoxa TaxID=27342 RepID=A0A0H2RT21_9AGAM|nr:hypothetical protein SCHPADRAFT_939313 [Schizopora paradoxa]